MDSKRFIGLLGPLPGKISLAPKIIDEIDCGKYWRRTIEYAVEKDERIKAYLCLPKNLNHKLPAIYCFHQHAGNYLLGKSEVVGLAGDPDLGYAKELAELGFITLASDAICFEDRCLDKESPKESHLHQLHSRLVRGQTLMGKVLQDISAGIDLLQSLPEVDSERIGFIGFSYGGRAALFAPVFDGRIRTSVCCCGSTNYRNMPAIQYDFVLPDILNHGDIEDIVRMVEPSNLLIIGGELDKWSIGIEEMIKYARPAFKKGILEGRAYPGGHQFTREMRKHAYGFLSKHLGYEMD